MQEIPPGARLTITTDNGAPKEEPSGERTGMESLC